MFIFVPNTYQKTPGYLSRYSDELRAGWSRNFGSIPDKGKRILFFMVSRPALGPKNPPVQWVPGDSFPGGKAAEA
jgi:hypothetical protein